MLAVSPLNLETANPERSGDAKPNGTPRVGRATERTEQMAKASIKIVCAFVLSTCAMACGGATTVQGSAPAVPQQAAPQSAAPEAREAIVMGPTEGASADPAILAWQNDLLTAMGREGQHELFSLLVVENDADQVYVGIDTAGLGLTKEESDAASAVQTRYAQSAIHARSRANLWVVPLVHPASTVTATASR
jgi:hypothetical protein